MTDLFRTWRADLPASIVVALVALPLCLGVALASGAPLFSGLIAGIVGGIVVGALSGSRLSVAGPAAGLTVIVLSAIESLPSYPAFLLAVVLAGALQIAFGATRAGVLAEFVPSSVITGMLAAIGLILILKQVPHAIGYDGDYEGSFEFFQADGYNTFSSIWHAIGTSVTPGAALIAAASLAFLFWWDKARPSEGALKFLPGPLVVVVIGVAGNALLGLVAPGKALGAAHLVQVPVAESFAQFAGYFTAPDFAAIGNATVWTVAVTLAIVASLESLLSVKAVDELDPKRRTTPKNRELFAQGSGNIVSGLLGGLPVTSVIVRSSANVDSGADSRLSTMLHGAWLLLSVLLIPTVLNLIPLSALAAVLIATGYKLAKPRLFVDRWRQGLTQFAPFVVTILAILFTDLLIGIVIGLAVGFAFVVARNFRTAITTAHDEDDWLIRARRNLYFIHKYELQRALDAVPDGANLLIDLSSTGFVDLDNVDVINAFIKGAGYRNISVIVRGDVGDRSAPLIAAPARASGVRMKESKQLLLANQAWAAELREENPHYFARHAQGQRPHFLWIGCSDSRVAPEQMTQAAPGALFIHRNVANLVNSDDLNLMSVLQYAVDVLEVPNIVVCGHHGCGGVTAALAGGTAGPVDRWLGTARRVLADHREEIDAQPSEEAKVNRLVEVNVRDQLVNLARTDTVVAAFAASRNLTLHGWVYDIRDGLLKPLMKINRTTDLTDLGRPDRVLRSTAELEAELA